MEEECFSIANGGVGKTLVDQVQTKSMVEGQVVYWNSVSICFMIQLEEGSCK